MLSTSPNAASSDECCTWPSVSAALSDAEIVGIVTRWHIVQALAGASTLAVPNRVHRAAWSGGVPSTDETTPPMTAPSLITPARAAAEPVSAIATDHRVAISSDEPSPTTVQPSPTAAEPPPSPSPAATATPSTVASHGSKCRVSFCMNAGPRRGVVLSAAVVPRCAATVLRVGANKLRLTGKQAGRARCFVWHTGAEARRACLPTACYCLLLAAACCLLLAACYCLLE